MYNGSSLSQMKVVTQTTANGQTTSTTYTLDFTYDASGSPVAVTYDGTTYYYALNLQGDVVAILNGSGSTVVSYTYDAWGYEKTCTGTMASTLGQYNPLRYRGYVYDPEYKLYYLESRYYNPGLGRFINADAFASTGQGILGNNMFAYCGNNPVINIDKSGTRYTPAEIHNFVVDDICWNDPNKTRSKPKIKYKEVYFGHEYGFCDVYDLNTHEVWEVKRINGGATCTLDAAQRQLGNYVFNGILKSHTDWELRIGGTETVIPGNCFAIPDKDGNGTYIIGYWDVSAYSPIKGVIFYDYMYIPDAKEAATTILALTGVGIGVYLYKQIEAATEKWGVAGYVR